MKKLLKAVSWVGFYLLAFACVIAVLSTLCGAGFFVAALVGVCEYSALNLWAIGYFGSIVVIIVCCITYSIYEYINKIRLGK